jgi:hypothetical protein
MSGTQPATSLKMGQGMKRGMLPNASPNRQTEVKWASFEWLNAIISHSVFLID